LGVKIAESRAEEILSMARPARIVVSIFRGHDLFWDACGGLPGAELIRRDTPAAAAAALGEADALVISGNHYLAEVAAAAQRSAPLAWIHLISSGIDLAERHGVKAGAWATNSGAAWAPSVAEHAVGLYLALARQIPAIERARQAHAWEREPIAAASLPIEGTTAAIIGFGRIGRAIAQRLRGFDLRIIGVGRRAGQDPLADRLVGIETLDAVLAEADAVFLATPLTPETTGLIGSAALARMKPTALLVNVARGAVIDEAALAAALAAGRIAGAGLDVFGTEPLPETSPLWGLERAILSPHTAGFAGDRGLRRAAAITAEGIRRFVAGEPPGDPLPLPGARQR